MTEFRVTPSAFRDLDEIRIYLELQAGDRVADRVEERIFDIFDMLVRLKPVGYSRKDLRQPELNFTKSIVTSSCSVESHAL